LVLVPTPSVAKAEVLRNKMGVKQIVQFIATKPSKA